MANDDQTKSTLKDTGADPELRPDTTPDATETLNPANDERTLDVGESGQFAPGGYYNQHAANRPDRIDLDEQFPTGGSDDKS